MLHSLQNRPPSLAALLALAALACGDASRMVSPAPLGFGSERTLSTHREIEVGFVGTDGAVLSGTLLLPRDSGNYAGVIFHFGSNRWSRLAFESSAIDEWLAAGIAVLTYDKRGVGRSQGECCPWQDPGYFPLLGHDVLAGARLMAQHPEINPNWVGTFGFSQAGWVLPVSDADGAGAIAFTVIGSGPTVSLGEELLYSQLTGENQCQASGRSRAEIDQALAAAGPSLFRPLPFLRAMTSPGFWIFGENDLSVPVPQSLAILDSLVANDGKRFRTEIIPNANHSWIIGGGICQESGPTFNMLPTIFPWIDSAIAR